MMRCSLVGVEEIVKKIFGEQKPTTIRRLESCHLIGIYYFYKRNNIERAYKCWKRSVQLQIKYPFVKLRDVGS